MAATFACPSCGRTGSVSREIPAGAKIRCPGCQSLFAPFSEDELIRALKLPHDGPIALDSPSLPSSQPEPGFLGNGADEPAASPSQPATGYSLSRHDLPIVPASVHLDYVRNQTCYRRLRILVTLTTYGMIALCVLLAAGFCLQTGVQIASGNAPVSAVILLVTVCATACVGSFLAFATQEASSLLIDIADLLIDQGRKQR